MAELFADVVGQDAAVAELRAAAAAPVHAYLLLGPAGVGKRAAAMSFAACLVCPDGGCGDCRHCCLALCGAHPDVVTLERAGAYISVGDAREATRLSQLTPVEGQRRVLVLTDFHLVDRAAPALLKTIEEPPPTTVFVVLADRLAPELVTIASRCVTVELRPLSDACLKAVLEAEGASPEAAARAVAGAGGRLDRARLLVSDAGLGPRQAAWSAIPTRLDGTGATVVGLVEELLGATEGIAEPLRARHEAELDRLAEQASARGERGIVGRAAVEARHKREQRRLRVDELRAGLAALARTYAARLESAGSHSVATAAVEAIDQAARDLDRNPNETVLLQALLLRLTALDRRGPTEP